MNSQKYRTKKRQILFKPCAVGGGEFLSLLYNKIEIPVKWQGEGYCN